MTDFRREKRLDEQFNPMVRFDSGPGIEHAEFDMGAGTDSTEIALRITRIEFDGPGDDHDGAIRRNCFHRILDQMTDHRLQGTAVHRHGGQ